jgi:transposase
MKNYYLGGDVSKGYADFVILDSQKTVVEENFQLDDTFIGHSKLYEALQELLKKEPESQIYAAVESTGGYENNWYYALCKFKREMPISVVRLNPVGVHHNLKASLNRNITDKISARGIAEYLLSHSNKIRYDSYDEYTELRKQKKFIDMLTKQKVQIENQLESILYSANPELLVYCKKKKAQWLLRLLLKYPTAEKLSRAKVFNLKKIAYLKDDLAKKIIERAKTSVASSSGAAIEKLIVEMLTQVLHIDAIIEKQNKLMAENCKLEEVKILKSFIGIGDASAIGLILEIGFIERFQRAKNLASYFGLHPVYKQSGDGKWGNHMSKQGRKSARAILYMAAFSGVVYNPIIRELYKKCRAKGMAGNAALGMCMHKILRIIYGMLKNNTMFDPAIDIANQQKIKEEENIKQVDKNRRYQLLDESAPISRRQTKKRMAQIQPQNVNNIECGVMT